MWQTSGSQIRTQTAAAPQRSLHVTPSLALLACRMQQSLARLWL